MLHTEKLNTLHKHNENQGVAWRYVNIFILFFLCETTMNSMIMNSFFLHLGILEISSQKTVKSSNILQVCYLIIKHKINNM